MPDTPFTTHGDEALEARIVSWVLGEASAFEAAELERLCAERPELMVFKRRMRALHGLLTEAEKHEPDDGWKLPEAKRRALDELFGDPSDARLEAERETRVKRSGRRALLAIAACVVMTLVVLSLIPGNYEAAATIEVKPQAGMSPLANTMSESSGGTVMTPQFFATEFEKIKSRNSLEQVVDKLDLDARWGTDRETALRRLKENVSTKQVRGTDLIEIRAREKDPELAKSITNEVARSYQAYRTGVEQRQAEQKLAELNKAVREQEDKVEERRKMLATIVRTKGIVYKGQDSFYGSSGVDEDQGAKTALQAYHELEQEKMQREAQVQSLKKYDGDQLMTYASGLDLPDNTVRKVLPEYLDEKRKLAKLKASGISENDPSAKAIAESLETKKRQLDEGVANLRSTLQAQLDLTSERLKSVEVMRNESREEAIKKGLDAQDYVYAKRQFENDQELLQQMKLRKLGEEISLRTPRESVEVHEQATAAVPANPLRAAASKLAGVISNRKMAVGSPEQNARMESLPEARGMVEDASQIAASSYAEPTGERLRELQSRIPAELTEGAPKPMNMPNLEVPAGGPVGSSSPSLARRDQTAAEPAVDALVMQDRDDSPKPARPAAPPADSGTPVPSAEVPPPAIAFGNADGFGAGWGGAVDGGAARTEPARGAKAAAPAEVTSGVRSSTAAVEERSIGGVLSEPQIARSNAASTDAHKDKVDEVRRDLYTAEGNYNLGKFDEAKRDYENALRADPYNQAARRGLEKIAAAKSDYYKAAYDQTRAELLAEVDKSWEKAVPEEGNKTTPASGEAESAKTAGPLSDLAQREIVRRRLQNQNDGLKRQLEESSINDSNKRELFRQWSANRKELESPADAGVLAGTLSLDPAAADQQQRLNEQAAAGKAFGVTSGTTEYKLQTGHQSEYFFRAPAIGGDAKEEVQPPLAKEGAGFLFPTEHEPAPVPVTDEIPTSEEPFSTFSLNISDASFQIAQAALAKGERPDPAGVKVEQFYNAVDYGDPAPANGEPVAVNIGQAAHPVIPGRTLVRIAVKTAAAGRSAAQPLRLTLMVDQSGSMAREDRRAAMDKALAGLAGLLTDKDEVTVIGFARTPRLLGDALAGDKARDLAGLVNQAAAEGGTNLEEAIKLARQLAERHRQPGAQNRIVLFTDGAANLGNADPGKLAAAVRELRQRGIAFDIAGIAADGLNDELLGELARNGNGRYHVIGKGGDDSAFARQLAGAFRPAAENVKVQVRFNPDRVARYKLIGFEKDRLRTEDFRNDAVDAAELAAEEAGVAIYQVEPIPGGSGELGEVGVRFRDTAASAMVERSWTLAHETAPAIDRAAPSMQLATLTMLAGEKLRGGPLADAIDFKQLADARAGVRRFYGDTGRPAEVLRMIEMIK